MPRVAWKTAADSLGISTAEQALSCMLIVASAPPKQHYIGFRGSKKTPRLATKPMLRNYDTDFDKTFTIRRVLFPNRAFSDFIQVSS